MQNKKFLIQQNICLNFILIVAVSLTIHLILMHFTKKIITQVCVVVMKGNYFGCKIITYQVHGLLFTTRFSASYKIQIHKTWLLNKERSFPTQHTVSKRRNSSFVQSAESQFFIYRKAHKFCIFLGS